jgi:hypothetical protein
MSRSVPEIHSVRYSPAGVDDQRRGLLGWVTCTVANLVLDGITVRRTQAGRLTLSFPARRGRGGESHAYVRPLDDRARLAIEREIFDAIDLDGGAR